ADLLDDRRAGEALPQVGRVRGRAEEARARVDGPGGRQHVGQEGLGQPRSLLGREGRRKARLHLPRHGRLRGDQHLRLLALRPEGRAYAHRMFLSASAPGRAATAARNASTTAIINAVSVLTRRSTSMMPRRTVNANRSKKTPSEMMVSSGRMSPAAGSTPMPRTAARPRRTTGRMTWSESVMPQPR